MIDRHDVTGKEEGTKKLHSIAGFQRKPAFHAQQIEAGHGNEGGDPHTGGNPFPDHDAQNGNDDHIESGEKSRFCCCGGGDTDLLGSGGDKEKESAEESSGNERPSVPVRAGGAVSLSSHYRHEGKECDPGQPAAAGEKGKGTHIVCSYALGDECRAPDHGGKEQEKGADDFLGPGILHDLPPNATSSKLAYESNNTGERSDCQISFLAKPGKNGIMSICSVKY